MTAAFAATAALSGRQAGVPRAGAAGQFAHTLVPIIIGYFIAHSWSLLVLVGQQTFIQLSDPLGTGASWLGAGGRGIEPALADPTLVATIQVTAIVTGHILGVVGYTIGGLWPLFAA